MVEQLDVVDPAEVDSVLELEADPPAALSGGAWVLHQGVANEAPEPALRIAIVAPTNQ